MGVNSLHWYYIPAIGDIGQTADLVGEEWHHCFHVMRMREGDQLILCNGKGVCMEAVIRTAATKQGLVEITRDLSDQFKHARSYSISVGMAPTKNMDRTEFAVEKLVEVGIDEIYFLDCRHNERTFLRLDRIQKIVNAAAKQSRKIQFPDIHDLIPLSKCIERKKEEDADIQILACHMDADSKSVAENYLPGRDVLLLIGPEGGFSKAELDWMTDQKVNFVHLGPFRLRVETAALMACAHIHFINQLNTR